MPKLIKHLELLKALIRLQTAVRDLRTQKAGLETDLETLRKLLSDMRENYNPNFQDLGVKSAVDGFKEWESRDLPSTSSPAAEGTGVTSTSDLDLDELDKLDALGLLMTSNEEEEEVEEEEDVSKMCKFLKKLRQFYLTSI